MVKRVFPIYRAAAGHGIQLQRLRIIPNRDCKRMCKIVFAFNAKIDVCRFARRRRCRVRIKKHRLRVYPECLGTRRRRPNKAAQNRCGKNDCSSKKSCKSAFCFLYFSVCHLILNPPRDSALILSFFCMICNTLQQKPRPRSCPQGRGLLHSASICCKLNAKSDSAAATVVAVLSAIPAVTAILRGITMKT